MIDARLLAVLRRQRAALQRLEPAYKAQILDVYRQAQREAEERLRALPQDRFVAAQQRVILAQATAAVAELEGRLDSVMREMGANSAEFGANGLLGQISHYADAFGEEIRGTVNVDRIVGALRPGLLERYENSVNYWGLDKIAAFRREMGAAAAQGKTLSESWQGMAKSLGIKPYQAERIVRTETSFAANYTQLQGMLEAADAEEWRKTIVDVFDHRTGPDSYEIHGQVVKLDGYFRDIVNGGRFLHPTNRPNDRGTLLFLPVEEARRMRRELKSEAREAK